MSELGLPAEKMIKAVLYTVEDREVLALVRGDYEVNEIKLANLLDVVNLDLAKEAKYEELDTVKGFTGPIDLAEVEIIADQLVMSVTNGVTGGNQTDKHYLNVNPNRDFEVDTIADIRTVKPGEKCSDCGGELKQTPGIEVGQVFKLGTKYSRALDATFLDQNGKPQPLVMGCYGIGITRTIAAAIEQNHDDYGIKWPTALAPFTVHLMSLGASEEVEEKAQQLYQDLTESGIEVLLDDRNERAGVKFNDADLIGAPIRITIGARSLAEGELEVKLRQLDEEMNIDADNDIAEIKNLITEKI
jgi:prolyl-tRNA synthetase